MPPHKTAFSNDQICRRFRPVTSGKTKIAGLKIPDTQMIRLMEVLLYGGTQLTITQLRL
jgi:hypothetical protein